MLSFQEVTVEVTSKTKSLPGVTMGNTPLHKAAANNNVEQIKMILNNCPNEAKKQQLLTARDGQGNTPLHYAVYYVKGDRLEAVQCLLDNGANVDSVDDDNDTPLHYACKFNKQKVALYLLERGSKAYAIARSDSGLKVVNVFASKESNCLPQDRARERGYIELADMIEQYAKKVDTKFEEFKKQHEESKIKMSVPQVKKPVENKDHIWRQIFHKIETKHDGRLDGDELQAFISRFKHLRSITVDKLMEHIQKKYLDATNSTTSMSIEEWVQLLNNLTSNYEDSDLETLVNTLLNDSYYIHDNSEISLRFDIPEDCRIGVLLIGADNFEMQESPVSAENRNALNKSVTLHGTKVNLHFSKMPDDLRAIAVAVYRESESDDKINFNCVVWDTEFDTEIARHSYSTNTEYSAIVCMRLVRLDDSSIWKLDNRTDLISCEEDKRKGASDIFSHYCQQRDKLVHEEKEKMTAVIEIKKGRDVIKKDLTSSDPYYILYYGEKQLLKSDIQKKTLNPDWTGKSSNIVHFETVPNETDRYTFLVELWDYDRLTADDFMGFNEFEFNLRRKRKIVMKDKEIDLNPRGDQKATGCLLLDATIELHYRQEFEKRNYLELSAVK